MLQILGVLVNALDPEHGLLRRAGLEERSFSLLRLLSGAELGIGRELEQEELAVVLGLGVHLRHLLGVRRVLQGHAQDFLAVAALDERLVGHEVGAVDQRVHFFVAAHQAFVLQEVTFHLKL